MSAIKDLDITQKDKSFERMLLIAENKRKVELLDIKIEALDRDWLESLSNRYTEILSKYNLTFDELDDSEKYQLIAREITCKQIAVNREIVDEYTFEVYNNFEEKFCESLVDLDFSSKRA